MQDEHMLMLVLVFVLGFMVERMMRDRLIEGDEQPTTSDNPCNTSYNNANDLLDKLRKWEIVVPAAYGGEGASAAEQQRAQGAYDKQIGLIQSDIEYFKNIAFCLCPNGVAAQGCKTNGQIKCSSCNPGFSLVNNQCVKPCDGENKNEVQAFKKLKDKIRYVRNVFLDNINSVYKDEDKELAGDAYDNLTSALDKLKYNCNCNQLN
jgi:hypothetical protein